MFTIKHVMPDGLECIYPASGPVTFLPAKEENEVKDTAVTFLTPNNGFVTISGGRVFVMNENGATVAKYILKGDPDFPHGFAHKN